MAYSQTWTTVGSPGFTVGQANFSSIATWGSEPYVVFQDGTYGGGATVMKYNGSSWVTVGTEGFSAGEEQFSSIAIDGAGTPYVVYQDVANSAHTTVMKFNGSSWDIVGSTGFSGGPLWVEYTSIAIDGSGTPYVVYADYNYSGKAIVMKFNGSNWISVGDSTGLSAGEALYTNIAIDSSGTPYVVYQDRVNSYKATVKKYNGSNWVTVGSAGFSADTVQYTCITIEGGLPYVAYQDWGNGQKATLMKFNGTDWVNVGIAGFSAGIAAWTSVTVDPGGTPYVAYKDFYNSYKATVMKFSGGSWVNAGSAGFSAGAADWTSITKDPSGSLYVVYEDVPNSTKATVMKLETPLLPITGPHSVCAEDTIHLSDSTSGGAWSSSNTVVAVINAVTGVVTGLTAGVTIISYTLSGNIVTDTVTVNPLPNAGIITGASTVCADSSITLTDTVSGGVWSSSNTAIATVGSTGIVSGVTEGSAAITYLFSNICGTATTTQMVTVNPCNTGVENPVKPFATLLSVFPNPSHGSFVINLSSSTYEDARIVITNMLGEKVKEWTLPSNKETAIQLHVPPGVYFISAVTWNERANAKIVVE